MSRKSKVISSVIALIVILSVIVVGCSNSDNKGLLELSPKEMKKYMDSKESGFVMYMDSQESGFVMLSSKKNKRAAWIKEAKKSSEEQKVTIRELNEKRDDVPGTSNPNDWGLSQDRNTLAYYQNGHLKEQIDLEEIEPDKLKSEIDKFIKKMQEDYPN